MSPLRFRAWIPNGKTMFYQEDQYLGSFVRRVCMYLTAGNKAHESYIDGNIEDYLMQSTGLFDREGREIFELHEVSHYGYRYRVEWSQPHCAFVLRDISGGDIIVLHDGIELEITGEYSPLEKDQEGACN